MQRRAASTIGTPSVERQAWNPGLVPLSKCIFVVTLTQTNKLGEPFRCVFRFTFLLDNSVCFVFLFDATLLNFLR